MALKDWKKKRTPFGIEYTKGNQVVYFLPRYAFDIKEAVFRVSIWKDKNESPIEEKEFSTNKSQALAYAKKYMENN